MPESLRSRLLRWTFNLFPAYRGTGARVRYIASDPLEYDLGRLENDAAAVESAATRLGSGMTEITGRTGQDGMAIMTQRLDQVRPLLAELEKRRTAVTNPPPFQKVVSIFDLVPEWRDGRITA